MCPRNAKQRRGQHVNAGGAAVFSLAQRPLDLFQCADNGSAQREPQRRRGRTKCRSMWSGRQAEAQCCERAESRLGFPNVWRGGRGFDREAGGVTESRDHRRPLRNEFCRECPQAVCFAVGIADIECDITTFDVTKRLHIGSQRLREGSAGLCAKKREEFRRPASPAAARAPRAAKQQHRQAT